MEVSQDVIIVASLADDVVTLSMPFHTKAAFQPGCSSVLWSSSPANTPNTKQTDVDKGEHIDIDRTDHLRRSSSDLVQVRTEEL